jgi:hypothetical protein
MVACLERERLRAHRHKAHQRPGQQVDGPPSLITLLTFVPLIRLLAPMLSRPAVDSEPTVLGFNGMKPVVEAVAPAAGRGICLPSDARWSISRRGGEDLSSDMTAERATGAHSVWRRGQHRQARRSDHQPRLAGGDCAGSGPT